MINLFEKIFKRSEYFEQVFIAYLLDKYKFNISFINGHSNFTASKELAHLFGYVHLLADSKRRDEPIERIKLRLKQESPELYEQVQRL